MPFNIGKMTQLAACLALICLVSAFWVPGAQASGTPSPESCAGVGTVKILCSSCFTPALVAGEVVVTAQYDSRIRSCVNHDHAYVACDKAYGMGAQYVDYHGEYKINLSSFRVRGTGASHKCPAHYMHGKY